MVSRIRQASASSASAWPCAMKSATVAPDDEYHRSFWLAIAAQSTLARVKENVGLAMLVTPL